MDDATRARRRWLGTCIITSTCIITKSDTALSPILEVFMVYKLVVDRRHLQLRFGVWESR